MVILALVVAAAVQAGAPAGEPPIRLDPTLPQPRLVKSSSPELPEEAAKAWLHGSVVVEYTVGSDGRVLAASALHGDSPLTDAALKAVRKWRFESLVLDGRPTEFINTVQVNFPLGRKFWLPKSMLPDVIDSLSSNHEAIRGAAAAQLGRVFRGMPPSSDKRWAEQELKGLLKREQAQRVRVAIERALADLDAQTPLQR